MPKNKEALIRYRIIDRCLKDRQHKYPSKQYLLDRCEEKLGTSFATSTIEKDIFAMRFDEALAYNAPIKFDKNRKGYYYEDENFTIASVSLNSEELEAIEFAAAILDQFKGVGIFEKYDHAINKIFDAVQLRRMVEDFEMDEIIQIEKAPSFKGSELLGQLIECVKDRKTIQFDYQAFDSDKIKTRTVHPYLLKEFRNRWYLIGLEDQLNRIATFGLDRIQRLNNSSISFRYFHEFEPQLYFKHAFGITSFKGKPEKVLLKFSTLQGKYVKTQSLHATQKVVEETEDSLTIELEVGITIELIMQILSYGPQVEVLQPCELKNKIGQLLEQTLEKYTNIAVPVPSNLQNTNNPKL